MPRKGECMDLTGQKFGRWTVIERSIPRYNKKGGVEGMWRCVCDCGTQRIVLQASLINGKSKSCGCLNREITSSKLKNMDIRIVIVTYIPYGMELSIVAIAKTQRIIRIMEVGG